MSKLENLQTQLSQATRLEELHDAVHHLRDYYQISHAVYHWVNSVGERYYAGTYSEEWVNRYIDQNYVRIDPVVIGCMQRFDPVNWKQLDWSKKATRVFLREAIDYGVGSQGFSVPIRGPSGQYALFTVTSSFSDDDWQRFVELNKRDMILIAHTLNQRALEFEDGQDAGSTPNLSPREITAMTFLARGLSRAQAAQEMEISEHTLRVYIEAARHKLGALNTTHAVARALAMGLIIA